jgi:hypothetical protein
MIPYVIVLEPGLVIYKIYMGYWFFERPTMEHLRQDLGAVTGRTGTLPRLNSEQRGTKAERNSFIPTARRTCKHLVNKTEGRASRRGRRGHKGTGAGEIEESALWGQVNLFGNAETKRRIRTNQEINVTLN